MLQQFLSSLPFMTDTRADAMINAFFPIIKAGFMVSVPLALASFVLGMILATIVAIVRVMPIGGVIHRVILGILKVYISIIRGTPMLVQLAVVFYGLPAINIFIDPIPAAVIGFSLNVGAYGSEIVRAAILSVAKGQWEAGFSIGMTYMQTFCRIIAPQALRVAVPPLSNNFIGLFKETSLASFVTVTEMFRVAQQHANTSYDFVPIFIEVGALYWCLCWVLFWVQNKLEQHFDRYVAR